MEIERLKEELGQQKDREDRARRLINQRLKQKTNVFDRLHHDYKQLNVDHKKLITKSDRQQEKFRELRDEVNWMAMALAEEQLKGAEVAKQLAKAAKERMELQLEHYVEMECTTMALHKVQTTYHTQRMHYKSQEAATASLIKKLKEEWQVMEDKSKMGLGKFWTLYWHGGTERRD